MTKSALLLGSTPRVVVTIARCLKKHGVESHVAGLMHDFPRINSVFVSSFQYISRDQIAFVEQLREIISKNNIGVIFPLGDEALSIIGRTEKSLREMVIVACPPKDIVEKVLNKDKTLQLASSLGISVPFEYYFTSQEELEEKKENISFPIIIKPKSKSSNPIFRIKYFYDYNSLLREIYAGNVLITDTLVQEYVPGVGVGIEVLLHSGDPIAIFQHRRITELPITGGVSVRARSEVPDPVLVEHSLRLLRALGWSGVAMVEYRYDPTSKRAVLMEINGRYWGSIPLSYLAGVDFPWYQWQLAIGQEPVPKQSYKLISMRWFAGELSRMPQIVSEVIAKRQPVWWGAREFFAFFAGFLDSTQDAIWSRKDQRPFWDELSQVWRQDYLWVIEGLAKRFFPQFGQLLNDRRLYGSAAAGRLAAELNKSGVPAEFINISRKAEKLLVVCHGNIMRSAFCAGVLQELTAHTAAETRSAGLAAIDGKPADEMAVVVAREFGVNLNQHRAQSITAEMMEWADLILVMDYRNLAMLLTRWPNCRHKTAMLTAWSSNGQILNEIPDPFGKAMSDVKQSLSLIADCSKKLIHSIKT